MAEKHIADKEAEFVAVNGPPDMCRVGNSVIPFDITDTLDKARDPSANVHARGNPVLTQTTRVNSVAGDAGSGVVSGVSRGHTIVLQGSSTVFVNGKPCARHDDPVGMNCNGGDTFNTTGQLKTLKLGPKPKWGSKEAGKDLRERLKETSQELQDNPNGKTPEQAAAVQDKVKQLVADTAEHEKAAMQAAMKGGGDTATWTEASTLKSGARNMAAEAERQVKWANSSSKELVNAAGGFMPLSGLVDAVQDGSKAWGAAQSGNYLGATGHAAMAVFGVVTELPVLKQLKGAVKLGKAAGAAKAAGTAKDVAKGAGAAKDAGKGAEAAKDGTKAGEAAKDAEKAADAAGGGKKGGGKDGVVVRSKPKGGAWDYAPNFEKWEEAGGRVVKNADGSVTYVRKDGVSVTYGKDGFPDFSPHAKESVQIDAMRGDHYHDFKAANEKIGLSGAKPPEGFTWHHAQDGRTMQLVPTSIHNASQGGFAHAGGVSVIGGGP